VEALEKQYAGAFRRVVDDAPPAPPAPAAPRR
jgi:hypothetical protein